jgi:hypothetical protein
VHTTSYGSDSADRVHAALALGRRIRMGLDAVAMKLQPVSGFAAATAGG